VLNSVDPYGKAFELYDSHLETQALKDPDYREKMKAELKAEALAELKAEAEAEAKAAADKEALADSIPPSLAETRAAGGNTPPAQVIADPLDTTFNR
jgi:membrane protein involved in colicin uptake